MGTQKLPLSVGLVKGVPPSVPALHPCLMQLTFPSVCCVNAKLPNSGGMVPGCALVEFEVLHS